jgi:hypothetical protein
LRRRAPSRHRATPARTRSRRLPIAIAAAVVFSCAASAATGLVPLSFHSGSGVESKLANGGNQIWSDGDSRVAGGSADAAGQGAAREPGAYRPSGVGPSRTGASSSHGSGVPSGGASSTGAAATGTRASSTAGSSTAGSPLTPLAQQSSATKALTVARPTSVNITTNIAAAPSTDASCRSAPTGTACTNAAISALNHARAVLGLGSYAIPAGFVSMNVAQQLLTLSNLDRVLYGLQAISGINTTLNSAAQLGVTNGGDPSGVDVGSNKWQTWASNWAAGYPNATFAYYAWMYDDGPGSANIACSASDTAGCWGHRLNILRNFGSGVQIALGVGYNSNAYTQLFESFAASANIAY